MEGFHIADGFRLASEAAWRSHGWIYS